MEFFQRAKVFRLKCSSQSKYLIAHKDEETILQSRDKSSNNALWTFELVEGKAKLIRLRSCWSWRYLTATEDPFLLGMTGKKILQTISQGPAVCWEPIKEGYYIKLKSHTGSFLRANRGPLPWRNSVTHDESGHWTCSENMTLWIVDIVEIDYQSSRMGVHTTSTEEVEEIDVAAQKDALSPAAYFSPMGSFDQEGSATTDVCTSTEASDSFNKLKSMLASLDEALNVNATNGKESDTVSEYSVQSTSGCIQPIEIKRAKQTIDKLKSLEFHTILSLGQDKKLEKAVNVLIAGAKSIGRGEITIRLVNMQEQLKTMKNDHVRASQVLIEYSTFCTRRLEIRDELRKDAAKARELETFQVNVTNKIADLRAKREKLLKQLEETENTIKEVEKTQANCMVEVEELILKIEQKSKVLKEMECKDKSWRVRKNEAESTLKNVEKDWESFKNSFQMFDNI